MVCVQVDTWPFSDTHAWMDLINCIQQCDTNFLICAPTHQWHQLQQLYVAAQSTLSSQREAGLSGLGAGACFYTLDCSSQNYPRLAPSELD